MAKLNVAEKREVLTHEGARAWPHTTPEQQLRRSVLSCLLWEGEFYKDGKSIAERITQTALACKSETVAALAIEARSKHNLRHVPLLLLCVLAAHKVRTSLVSETIEAVIQRADELSELVAVYWAAGKKPLPAQFKKGLARAFTKFDEYALGKYDRAGKIRLRDVLFLCHAKPKDDAQAALWKRLVANELAVPDTWEVALSGGADKREAFTRLITEQKLGYLALLRNLRNMTEAGVERSLIEAALLARKGAHCVLPFRFVAAARACPQLEPVIDRAMVANLDGGLKLAGSTAILVDVSRSMEDKLSARSDLSRMDAAAALASVIGGDRRVFTFSNDVKEVAPRFGMAGVDAINNSQAHESTRLFDAVAHVNKQVPYDRIIVITDEQATDPARFGYYIVGDVRRMPDPNGRGYLINVASAKNGVGYGKWTHIDGFSENVIRWIVECESGLSQQDNGRESL